MRFLTWNIENGGGNRTGSFVCTLAQQRPDVVVLTEVNGTNSRFLRRALAEQGYDHIETTCAGGLTDSVLFASKLPFTVIDEPPLQEPEPWLFR